MTDITQQERARLRALRARDSLLIVVEELLLGDDDKMRLKAAVEDLYSAALLVICTGAEPVYPAFGHQLKKEEP